MIGPLTGPVVAVAPGIRVAVARRLVAVAAGMVALGSPLVAVAPGVHGAVDGAFVAVAGRRVAVAGRLVAAGMVALGSPLVAVAGRLVAVPMLAPQVVGTTPRRRFAVRNGVSRAVGHANDPALTRAVVFHTYKEPPFEWAIIST